MRDFGPVHLRLIPMTAFPFILGVVPLVAATGTGAEKRQALGTAFFGGMLGVTTFVEEPQVVSDAGANRIETSGWM
ncbi:MAG: efflux RND transporter permease subunit [Verrucomicrobiota bacterium]